MNRTLSVENLMSSFPYVLSINDDMVALAKATSEELVKLYQDNDLLALYTHIDQLDETLLDILAYDFKVDWYLYDGTVQSKREQIKSHWEVHRHLGTKAATVRALNDICPGTLIEEWYEYGGKPYSFRVLIDISEQLLPITQPLLVRLVNIFKPVRTILEYSAISLRSHEVIEVGVTSGYKIYSSRKCGTYPRVSTQGFIYKEVIEVADTDRYFAYKSPETGDPLAGTYPRTAVQGMIAEGRVDVIPTETDAIYSAPHTGNVQSGTVPRAVSQGAMDEGTVDVLEYDGNAAYSTPQSGTIPRTSTQGVIHEDTIDIAPSDTDLAYSSPLSGTIPTVATQGVITDTALDVVSTETDSIYSAPQTGDVQSGTAPRPSTQGVINENTIGISPTETDMAYSSPLAGTTPTATTQGGILDKGISFESTGDAATYSVRACGTPFDSLI